MTTPEPILTREALIQALKEDLESFEFLRKYFCNPGLITDSASIKAYNEANDCITDAIARINDMLNVENARVMGEEKK